MPIDPFFSVIIPTHNRAHLISKAIESVLEQTESHWELLIIDDGSTDNTKSVVTSYTDARIRYIYQENAERSAARNHGVAVARGKYICFLDSDDYYLPHHLATFREAIANAKKNDALFFIDILLETNEQRRQFPNPSISFSNDVERVLQLHLGAYRTCSPHKILSQYPFNPAYTISEDTDVWTRLAQHHPVIHVPRATLVVVNHDNRTVDRSNTTSYKKNIAVKRAILQRDRSWISQRIRRKVLHDAWFSLAQSYFQTGNRFLMATALLRSAWYAPHLRWKEKLYMFWRGRAS